MRILLLENTGINIYWQKILPSGLNWLIVSNSKINDLRELYSTKQYAKIIHDGIF